MKGRKQHSENPARSRVLVLVDESNVGSSVRTAGRGLDWLKLREFLAGPDTGRELIEMVVYAGLPPPIPLWQEERDKKNKFMHWLRSNGFMVVTKDGAPAEEGHYKANVDVMMAIDALELSVEMQPDVVILVTGDADFAYLAIKLRRRGIRVEVASVAQNLGNILRSAANDVIDLAPLFRTFEIMQVKEDNRSSSAAPSQQEPSPGRIVLQHPVTAWCVSLIFEFRSSDFMAVLVMPKRKQKSKNQPKKDKRDFAQTTFSAFQQAPGTKPNLRASGQRHSRSSHGR